ncbi:cation diffusion facilitator family transporter [Paenibacillus sp. CN-4]|uniref:cation diffusion facilitator family transporter n=1 Tax=Paenibacillus nanchangensis TaxID=3348343 RepID=UPI003979C6E0
MQSETTAGRAETGAILSIIVYLILAAGKLAAGHWAGSQGLTADGLNNTTDILASLAVLIGLRISKIPADADHRYGHFRAETVASLVASFIMAAVGIQVLIGAAGKLMHPVHTAPDLWAAAVAGVSGLAMYGVYRYNLRLARETGSHALKAAAADNRSDAWVSFGTVIGIAGSAWGLAWLDALTALIVGLLICRTAWEVFREASHMLTDGFDVEELEKYKRTVSSMEGVDRVKDIRGRVYGNQIIVDLTIEVDQEMTVLTSHALSDSIEEKLRDKYNIRQTHVHIEPF